jgi:hypothetical protein
LALELGQNTGCPALGRQAQPVVIKEAAYAADTLNKALNLDVTYAQRL